VKLILKFVLRFCNFFKCSPLVWSNNYLNCDYKLVTWFTVTLRKPYWVASQWPWEA